jgi:hypothetical protein
MPLILTQNESNSESHFDYADVEGVQYQYPNQYRNKIKPGERFIYYRGSIDLNRKKRTPHYFGHGIIADVGLDSPPNTPLGKRLWLATIDEYSQFDTPVLFTHEGEYLETNGRRRGYFQPGVREVSEPDFDEILKLGVINPVGRGVAIQLEIDPEEHYEVIVPSSLTPLTDTLVERRSLGTSGGGNKSGGRRATHHTAKWVGRLAEETVYEYLRAKYKPKDVRWLEREGIRPGWDIEYIDESNSLIRVEVKGTTLSKMANCEITENEWRAAEQHRSSYRLYFVTGVGRGKEPKISEMTDPYGIAQDHPDRLVPTGYRYELVSD